ncbi:MAG: hypothetical protein MUE94_00425 [Verrucomicrobia bacterium]|jgi:hypothetical protein|nr:hypothetical protein [Verrucomicrobiota bacterium]
MKNMIALLALVAFACTASANCGKCGAEEGKPKTECCKKCKDCGADCKCKCHKAEKHEH